jgi:TPP-dependent indolepyruvate ferredoxin oxidoreductase alpha subunit
LEKRARNSLECLKENLMGNSEDQNANKNANVKTVNEVSYKNEDSIGIWTRGHSYYTVLKNLSIFSPCSDN